MHRTIESNEDEMGTFAEKNEHKRKEKSRSSIANTRYLEEDSDDSDLVQSAIKSLHVLEERLGQL